MCKKRSFTKNTTDIILRRRYHSESYTRRSTFRSASPCFHLIHTSYPRHSSVKKPVYSHISHYKPLILNQLHISRLIIINTCYLTTGYEKAVFYYLRPSSPRFAVMAQNQTVNGTVTSANGETSDQRDRIGSRYSDGYGDRCRR